MAVNKSKVVRWVSTSLLLLIFCLPIFLSGLMYIDWWQMSRRGHYYYEFPYLGMACLYFLAALVATSAVLYRGMRQGHNLLLLIPVLMFLVWGVFFSKVQPAANGIGDYNYLNTVAFDLDEWSGRHYRYPLDETEVQEALRSTTRMDEFTRRTGFRLQQESHYRLRGMAISYQVVLLTNSTGPRLTAIDGRPGLIYFAVSPRAEEYWLTMTALKDSSPGSADVFRVGGRSYIIHKVFKDGFSRTED